MYRQTSTLQNSQCEMEEVSMEETVASRRSQRHGLSVNLGGQWKQEKKGHFPDTVSFIVMAFKK